MQKKNTSWGDLVADWRSDVFDDSSNNPWSNKSGFRSYCVACDEVKENCHNHHTSYQPERTKPVCASCHWRIHNEKGYCDNMLPDFMQRRLQRHQDQGKDFNISKNCDEKYDYYLVELPSDYLNNGSPEILDSFDDVETAKSKMWRKIYSLDLHGCNYEIMQPGDSKNAVVNILNVEREMYILICKNCHDLKLTDKENIKICHECK